MRLALAQFRELAAFAQFASDLDEATRKQLERGQRVTELMKQNQYAPMSVPHMACVLFAVEKNHLDDVPVEKIQAFESQLLQYMDSEQSELMGNIGPDGNWNDDLAAAMETAITTFKKQAAI